MTFRPSFFLSSLSKRFKENLYLYRTRSQVSRNLPPFQGRGRPGAPDHETTGTPDYETVGVSGHETVVVSEMEGTDWSRILLVFHDLVSP